MSSKQPDIRMPRQQAEQEGLWNLILPADDQCTFSRVEILFESDGEVLTAWYRIKKENE